jgi:hypothetical protein
MTSLAHLFPPPEAYGGRCPCCGGAAHRVQRRLFDRFVNLFLPIYRYRCGSLGCSWEGILLVRRDSALK